MTQSLTASTRSVVLLVGLEPGVRRTHIEAALVLVGHRASALDDTIGLGLVTLVGDGVEVCDARLLRVVLSRVPEHQRRTAHLALACARADVGDIGTRHAFDALRTAMEAPPDDPSAVHQLDHDALTPQERRVAELAATGAPVSEIARAAFLSQKTVEHYLTRVYRKLGVRSKAELAFAYRAS